MPRARTASPIRGSSEAGNGTRTGGRAGKWRVAVMHGPVDGEVSRSSRIPPSIAATVARRVRPAVFVSWRRAPQVLAAAGPVDGRDHRALIRRGQRGPHRALAPALVPDVGPVGDA